MIKVNAICIYKDNMIYNLTVQHKHSNITLIRYDVQEDIIYPQPYKHKTFNDMYETILSILKVNNMCCGFIEQFGKKWYDIAFINIDIPYMVDRYGI